MLKKYLHTRLRVQNMDSSINFYNGIMGMEIIERKISPRGSQLVFLRFPNVNCDLELCSFPNSGTIEVPEDLIHLAFQVEDLEWCMAKLQEEEIPVTEGPIESENGTRFIFTEDPDKYEIELVEYPKK
ncbi:MAG TPA: VOC family protein [Nitrospinaceae bacterium]|jgi:lactoylglutathione lyase|nr:VOC family protein [Nitrospinaceae bacterium]HIL26036.1 VOC family protein [Nitrospinaceae bacterium]